MGKLLFILILFSFFSCSSKKGISKISEENSIVLNSILSNSSGEIYYQTITEDVQKPLESYFEPYLLEFNLCNKNVDSSIVKISKQEMGFLKENFKNQSKIRIGGIHPEFKNKITKKKERLKTFYISMPVVFRNGTLAIYYISGTYGGGFNLLRKANSKWEMICSNSVWIE